MSKKVLIITYYWPPAGGPGVQRWLKFVKYLPEYNMTPIVYCPKNPRYPIIDDNLEADIPKAIEVIRHPIFEPYKLGGVFFKSKIKTLSSGVIANKKKSFLEFCLLWFRGNLFIPDSRKFWVSPSVKFLKKYIEQNDIKTIITTGPPHSLHLIGLKLKKQCGVDWLADFRDPWTTIGYQNKLNLTSFAQKKHQKMELDVLENADKIIVTSPFTAREFETKTKTPIHLVTNGFDSKDFIGDVPLSEKFTMTHTGSLLTERNPLILWQIFKELIEEDKDFKASFQLQFAGTLSQEVLDSLKSFGLEEYVIFHGYLTHNNVIDIMKSSQVLLLLEIDSQETKAIVPGKLYEYLASKRPILAIGPKNWSVDFIFQNIPAGCLLTYNDKEKIKDSVLDFYKKYEQKKLNITASNISKYERKHLTESLINLIRS